jgi:hypothetical protein
MSSATKRAALRGLIAFAVVAAPLSAAAPAQAVARSCAWTVQITGDQVNALYPDEAARYWVAIMPVPDGGKAVIKGSFPHARYLSFNTYTAQTQAIDAIHDAQLVPDAGSENPFLPNADRRVKARAYTVTAIKGRRPATAVPANTIYTQNEDGTKSGNNVAVAIRIYEPDVGTGITGGEALPSVTTFSADGTRLVTYPDCPDTALPDLGVTQTVANAGPGALPGVSPSLFAVNPPVFHKYINTETAAVDQTTENGITGATVNPPLHGFGATAFPTGGFGENVDNKYVYATMSRQLGAVLVLRGRMPTYPQTYRGQPTMGTGQLRYWSLCAENAASQFYGCRNDDQIPLDGRRRYTVAVSTQASRPVNATTACGVTWLPAGPAEQTTLLLRNMLADPRFEEAIQRVEPGKEQQQMGPYYPRGMYYATPAAAERALGCRGSGGR